MGNLNFWPFRRAQIAYHSDIPIAADIPMNKAYIPHTYNVDLNDEEYDTEMKFLKQQQEDKALMKQRRILLNELEGQAETTKAELDKQAETIRKAEIDRQAKIHHKKRQEEIQQQVLDEYKLKHGLTPEQEREALLEKKRSIDYMKERDRQLDAELDNERQMVIEELKTHDKELTPLYKKLKSILDKMIILPRGDEKVNLEIEKRRVISDIVTIREHRQQRDEYNIEELKKWGIITAGTRRRRRPRRRRGTKRR